MNNLYDDVDRQGIPSLKKRDGNGDAELDSEKAVELIGHLNDAFTKTGYNEVPLTRRSAPFMDRLLVSSEGVIKLLKGLNPSKAVGPVELHP